MVAELVPEKELQPRAFSIMPLVWSIGSVFGPAFGGFFARPAEHYPGLFGNIEFFKKYPFALPNLMACFVFFISFMTGLLFLEVRAQTPATENTPLTPSGNPRRQASPPRLGPRPRREAQAVLWPLLLSQTPPP